MNKLEYLIEMYKIFFLLILLIPIEFKKSSQYSSDVTLTFIHKQVDIISNINEVEACMGPGGIFGNIRGATKYMTMSNVIASRNIDLLCIKGRDFYALLKVLANTTTMMQCLLVIMHRIKILLSKLCVYRAILQYYKK